MLVFYKFATTVVYLCEIHYHLVDHVTTSHVNLDDESGPGTDWVAYRKRNKSVVYFDSFGDLQPPLELMNYLGVNTVKYTLERYQDVRLYKTM